MGNLWVKNLKTNVELKLTSSEVDMTNGVPSFIIQEEFDRFTGYWWQPQKSFKIIIFYFLNEKKVIKYFS